MRPICLLHVITRLPIGGAEQLLLGIIKHLDPKKFTSVVCCIQDRGELADEFESNGVTVINLDLMAKGRFDRSVVPSIRKLIIKYQIDVIHTHLYHANLYGRLAARHEKKPVIASVHNTYAHQKWHRHLINRYLGRYTFCVTAGSADVKNDLIKIDHLPQEKILLLPNAIDLNRVSTSLPSHHAKHHLGFNHDDFVIGTVGRIEKQKGHEFLIQAISHIRNKHNIPKIKLLIIGDGDLLPALHQKCNMLGISDICKLPGSMPQLANIYRAIDVFVMPSLWEGLSLAMLEAMAAELPIIATNVGGVNDVIKHEEHGLIVKPGDYFEISSAIQRLYFSPTLRKQLSLSGAQRVRENYSITSMASILSTLYVKAFTNNHSL